MVHFWLWPDQKLSKSDSRRLREEHNALVNLNGDLLEALVGLVQSYSVDGDERDRPCAWTCARTAIARATKGRNET